jgi:hypothetical protein
LGVSIELAGVEPDVVAAPVRPDWTAVVLQRGNAPGYEFHSGHGPSDALLAEITDPWAECFQHLFWEHLTGPGGALGGRLPSNKEEREFFKNVDEEPEASEVLNFLHPLHVNEVILCSGGGDEGDASQALVQSRGAKRWRKYAIDGLMLIHASQA